MKNADKAPRFSRAALLFIVVAAPLLADFGLHLFLVQRANGFAVKQGTLVSLQQRPASEDSGKRKRPLLDVTVALPPGNAPRELTVRLRQDEAAAYAQVHRAGEVVPVWVAPGDVMLTPPLRLRPFEWFPYLHIVVAAMGLILGAIGLSVRAQSRQQRHAAKGRPKRPR